MSNKQPNIKALLRIFLVPTLVIKAGIMYFGLHYSMYPGDGYGYGLAACLAITLVNFGLFLWTFRNYTED